MTRAEIENRIAEELYKAWSEGVALFKPCYQAYTWKEYMGQDPPRLQGFLCTAHLLASFMEDRS